MSAALRISGVVMTFNEEANIANCLQSMRSVVDELVVYDSFSTDQTVSLSTSLGAVVYQHEFESFPAQRNRAIQSTSHDWVLLLDADETLSDQLINEIQKIKNTGSPVQGFWINRLNRIGDIWIRHGSWYPDKKMRLFNKHHVEFKGMDPHDIIDVKAGSSSDRLKGNILHAAAKDFASRFPVLDKHSTRAATAYFEKGKKGSWLRMCIKPFARFIAGYIVKGGFMDGTLGWMIARSEAYYVWMREAKLWELTRNRSLP